MHTLCFKSEAFELDGAIQAYSVCNNYHINEYLHITIYLTRNKHKLNYNKLYRTEQKNRTKGTQTDLHSVTFLDQLHMAKVL